MGREKEIEIDGEKELKRSSSIIGYLCKFIMISLDLALVSSIMKYIPDYFAKDGNIIHPDTRMSIAGIR